MHFLDWFIRQIRAFPNTLVPEKFRLAPRFGLAYSPSKSGGLLGKDFGRLRKHEHPCGLWDHEHDD